MAKLSSPPDAPRRITAADVARAAQVSRSAVSRAFTEGAYLEKNKRERILQVAAELGYRPNVLAAGLQGKGRSNLVAVVTGDLMNHYDSEILTQIVAELRRLGKWPVMVGGGADLPEADMLEVLGFPLDAMILRGGSVPDAVLEQCLKLRIPLIVSGRVIPREGVDSICCDNALGAAMAVEALLARGRSRIAYLGGHEGLTSDQERRQGFLEAMAKTRLAPIAVVSGDFSYESGFEMGAALLQAHPEIDGLFCANDAMALGALAAARHKLQRCVPESLSIIGFDDISMASWPDVALTTIRNDMDQTVAQIADCLVARLDAPGSAPRIIRIEPEFISRKTH